MLGGSTSQAPVILSADSIENGILASTVGSMGNDRVVAGGVHLRRDRGHDRFRRMVGL